MFTGIIKNSAVVKSIARSQENILLEMSSPILVNLSIDQSVSHDGICLTVDSISHDSYHVVAIAETQKKTNIAKWEVGREVNIETAMQMNALLDGHILQGHVDAVSRVLDIREEGGSRVYELSIPDMGHDYIVEKGSIALNGISLTCFDVLEDSFHVAIIPYTLEHTNIKHWKIGTHINIEYDIIAKLVVKQSSKYLNQIKPEK